jgi:hypothetical protein
MIRELRDLNDIQRVTRRGIYKVRLVRSNPDYLKICDYMQKINYCIQDLNSERENLQHPTVKSIVYATVLVDWLHEAVEAIEVLYPKGIIDGFSYEKADELQKAKKYLVAIRSFMVAHPLSTNRHQNYGFDGDLICIDIRMPNDTLSLVPEKAFYVLNHDGQSSGKSDIIDFYLYAYSRKVAHKVSSVYIGCQLLDIYRVAELYIDKLYALDRYLITQKSR